MAEMKYSKYILSELEPGQRLQGFAKMPSMVTYTDTNIIEGSHYFSVMVMGFEALGMEGHGPHIHKTPEILVALGTDMSNPEDLGAEFEMCMGPELEKHIINTSTSIFIPANFIHCPFKITKMERPFLFIQSQYAPKLTEKSYKQLVPPEMRKKMIFMDENY